MKIWNTIYKEFKSEKFDVNKVNKKANEHYTNQILLKKKQYKMYEIIIQNKKITCKKHKYCCLREIGLILYTLKILFEMFLLFVQNVVPRIKSKEAFLTASWLFSNSLKILFINSSLN